MPIAPYTLIAQSLVRLMPLLSEVVIHDLSTNTIAFIEGGLSKRQVGDSSLLGLPSKSLKEDVREVVYTKLAPDGRLLRSISVPLDEHGKLRWLMCINFDVSIFKDIHKLSELMLGVDAAAQPGVLFKNDWQEKVHVFIHAELARKDLKFNQLTLKQKKELVKALYDFGAFNEKHAADYIAEVLQLGRATIFNYLRSWKER